MKVMKINFNINSSNKSKFFVFLLLIFIVGNSFLFSSSISGSESKFEPRTIVDMPTAGVLSKGNYSINGNTFPNGGIALNFTAGIFTNFNLGLSFASNNIISNENLESQNLPGINLCYRIVDEKKEFPAITLGVNTQGKSRYLVDNKRFETLSPGLYLAVSKYFDSFIGNNSVHFGVNYSFEPVPTKRNINSYFGFEQTLGSSLSLNLEYNLLLNESDNLIYKNGKGLFNSSIKYSFDNNLSIELQFRDLLRSNTQNLGINRIFAFEYIAKF